MSYEYSILAFGPHPDDIEIGCGGVLYQAACEGKKTAVIDVTASDLATSGTPEGRQKEALSAAHVLGISHRENLRLPDCQIFDTFENRCLIARKIRELKPEIILIPRDVDRHPDHEAVSHIVKYGIFVAGLSKVDLNGLPIHRPRLVLQYMIWENFDPDCIVGLDQKAFDIKMQAFKTYHSQNSINEWAFSYFEGRMMKLGREVGKPYGEGYKLCHGKIGISGFDDFFSRKF